MKRLPYLLFCILLLLLVGCTNARSEADLRIYMMPKTVLTAPVDKTLTKQLSKTFAPSEINVLVSQFYSAEKLVVESAVGKNSIIFVPKEVLTFIVEEGNIYPLDQDFVGSQFQAGVMAGKVAQSDGTKIDKTALYAIPLEQLPFVRQAGYDEPGIFAFIPNNAPNKKLAIQVLKEMTKR